MPGPAPATPFGVRDAPDPDGPDIAILAAQATLDGSGDDDNAGTWNPTQTNADFTTLAGDWSSRWNGDGFDWMLGEGELRLRDDRVYILFDWDDGTHQGLIDAQRDGHHRLVGRYLNLSDPSITSPWVGLIVNDHRIDGRHSGGRIDFRR